MAREIGVSNITLWELKTDTQGGGNPTYGKAFKLPWAVNVETENEYIESEYKADNIIENSKKRISKITVKVEVSSDTPPALDCKITGKGYKAGKSFTKVGQNQPRLAMAYSILMDDATERRRVLHNLTLSRNSQNNKTSDGEDEDGETYTYEGVAIPLQSTGEIELIMDEKEIESLDQGTKETAQAEWGAFFEKVVLETGHATIQGDE